MARITIRNVQKAFSDFVAVKDSSFVVEDGEFFCLLGPSGCGKTTTLRMIAGLELPTAGTIQLGADDVTYRRAAERDIAFVFAEFRHVMCGELRALHDRLNATTVYVTHDQLEAMSMADKIAVMNNGVVEQIAPPQEIYDRPASLFVADFVGSPPLNFVALHAALGRGDEVMMIDGERVRVPALRENPSP